MSRRDDVALVLGASGGIGGEVARQLVHAGWAVRALKRDLPVAETRRDGIAWLRGDAMIAADVAAAAKGCAVIVHAVNPPGYRRWPALVLPMIDHTIAAALAEGATIVLPGTVYNFGPDALPLPTEASPQHPATRKGAIRVEMERRLEQATARGARVVIVRAGDFFGAGATSSWFAQGLVRSGHVPRVVRAPGAPGVGHQWAYVPDVARTMVALLERRASLRAFERFHMAGHWDPDGSAMTGTVADVVERHTGRRPRIASFPWWLVALGSPFVTTFREMREMRYLWERPLRMSNAALVAALGDEPHTALEPAVEATLLGLGCLGGRSAGRPR